MNGQDTDPFQDRGIDVYVETTPIMISSFMDNNEVSETVCFRCGEKGHIRQQCLTYKVRMCWHNVHGMCRDNKCTFAHDKSELRTPWRAKCVRVVKQNGSFVSIGCMSNEHTFRKCPLSKMMLHI